MLSETLKKRLTKDRPVTSITLRIPVDVVDSLKAIAPHKGFSGYQTLLKSYISEGLRRDEPTYASDAVERLAQALEKRGVSRKVLDDALRASIRQGQASGPGRPAKAALKRLDAKYRKLAGDR